MPLDTIGLITYHYPHLKTEQVLQRLLQKGGFTYKMYALPFSPRKPREVRIQHRPDQTQAVEPEVMAKKHDLPYVVCESDTDIDSACDVYLILGAGLLSAECVAGKKIINCHPGVIPASRGLDSFKWAIYEQKPLGISLHYIDADVDAGEVISVIPTNVYTTDTIDTLARRHYENEIDIMGRFTEYLERPSNPFANIAQGEARMRMPLAKEEELEQRFADYAQKYGA